MRRPKAGKKVRNLLAIQEPQESESEVTQSCLTLCNPMNCSLPGSSVHGIFQARMLEWAAIAFSIVLSTSGKIKKFALNE